jgi:FKBP-type peptidyl-prolyl cis-trans isomerase FkpA
LKSIVALVAAAVLSSTAMAAAPTTEKLPSGVIVQHLTQGTGAQPAADDVVKVNYRGTLPNGTEFDSSAKHGGPASFPLNRVIPCWTQGVQKMKVGNRLWRPWRRPHSAEYRSDVRDRTARHRQVTPARNALKVEPRCGCRCGAFCFSGDRSPLLGIRHET